MSGRSGRGAAGAKAKLRRLRAAGKRLSLALMGALALTGDWSVVELDIAGQGHVIVTGAAENTTALSNGSEVALSSHSVLTVDETGPRRSAFLERGEIILKIRATPARPFILQTIGATATVIADATLRVAIGAQIEFEVLDGIVKIALRGAKADAPARWLRKGDSLRVPNRTLNVALLRPHPVLI